MHDQSGDHGSEGLPACIDNVIMYSEDWEQHVKQLHAFMSHLLEA